ncbi:phage major capsid protein [Abyssisolibacter fermentans]|uniref:phage major capsid protein n=1 Tax=Abyssisolibacter fermentans TaxID=1766203 RepID=UPI00083508A7|nr:phage major capsid protein [Abyssisolibacter fermentans]
MDYKKLLKELTDKRAAKYQEIDTVANREALDKIELEIRKLDIQIKETQAKIDEEEQRAANEGRGQQAQPQGGFNPIGTYGTTGETRSDEIEDIYGTMEYRQAFKDYIVKGTPIPQQYQEARTAELTTVGDVAAVIPTTIMNKVIEDMTVEGKILNRITQTGFQGGVAIPISEVNPEATWLSSEEETSEEQKAKMKAKITFAYHVLEAKIALGLVTATVSLSVFETTIVKQLKKAMIRALETSIVAGTGSGQPLGFTKYTLPIENVVEMTVDTIGTVTQWAEVEAAIPEVVEDSVIYIMSKATWEKHLNGMTDTTGQKIGLGKINEKGQKILNGREVLTTGKLPSFDTAKAGDIFGALIDLSQYMLNSNLSMYYKKYFDEDKNKWIHKSLMIADGQMAIGKDSEDKLVGAQGLIYLKKKVE